MAPTMHRLQAQRIFRREYFHALRNGKNSDEAANQALTRVKAWFLDSPLIKSLDGIDRQEAWGEVLEVLVEWQILLKDIPIDMEKLPPKPPVEALTDPEVKKLAEEV